jgi:ATP-dependent RNA helicase RhlE
MEDGTIKLNTIQYLVLDEVDRMLDMGFLPQVRRIVDKVPKARQTFFFSATLPPEIQTMTTWVLSNPEIIEIGARFSPAETVTHALYPVAKDQKFDLFLALLERTHYDSAIVFTSTKIMADKVAHRLKAEKHAVAALHSNRTQRERIEALEGFRSGKYEVMVATDIAARGPRYRRRLTRHQLRRAGHPRITCIELAGRVARKTSGTLSQFLRPKRSITCAP